MALDFTNATLLGYNIQNEFLGDSAWNHRKVINLQVQGRITDGGTDGHKTATRAVNYEGVSETFKIINAQISNGLDYWSQDIIINGKSYGRGRVIGLSFDSSPGIEADMIRFGQYTAELEIYKEGDLELEVGLLAVSQGAITIGNSLKYNYPQYVNSWSEKLDIKKETDGSSTLTHTASVDLISGDYGDMKTDPIIIAKSLVAPTIGMSQADYMENVFGDFFFYDDYSNAVINGPGNTWSEDYDLVNYNFNFSRTSKVLPAVSPGMPLDSSANDNEPYGYEYTFKTTRSIQKDELGLITVSERGEIESFAGSWFDLTGGIALEVFNVPCSSSSNGICFPSVAYARCNASFNEVVKHSMGIGYSTYLDSLNTQHVSYGTQLDSGAGRGSWSISFNNKSGIAGNEVHEYTQTLTKNKNNIIRVSTNGSISSSHSKQTDWSAFGGANNDEPAALNYTVYEYMNTAYVDAQQLSYDFATWGGIGSAFYYGTQFVGNNWSIANPKDLYMTTQNVTWPEYGKAIQYSMEHTSESNNVAPANNIKTLTTNLSDSAPVPLVKPFIVPSRGSHGELIHDVGATTVGTRSIEVSAQHARLCNYSYLTGSEHYPYFTLYNFTPALTYMHDEARYLALNSVYQLNDINDMWVDQLTYGMTSEGQLTYSMKLKYTATRINPSAKDIHKSSNYNWRGP